VLCSETLIHCRNCVSCSELAFAAETELSAANLWFAAETESSAVNYYSLPNCVLCSETLISCRNCVSCSELAFVTCASSFGGYFWLGSDSVFLDCLWVKMGCVGDESFRHLWKEFRGLLLSGQRLSFPWLFMSQRGCLGWRIHSSPVKPISRAIFEWAATQFSLTLFESVEAVCDEESIRYLCKMFVDLFWLGSDSVFLDCLWFK